MQQWREVIVGLIGELTRTAYLFVCRWLTVCGQLEFELLTSEPFEEDELGDLHEQLGGSGLSARTSSCISQATPPSVASDS